MDRRYKENQFSDGRGAVGTTQARRDRLVEQYKAEARAVNRRSQSFGGSTGQPGGVYGAEVLPPKWMVSSLRGEEKRERDEVFDVVGGRSMGSRGGFSASRSWRAEGLGVKPSPTT